MSYEFDSIGATGDGLGTQYIVLRVKHVDVDKLKGAVGGTTGTALAMALPLIDLKPDAALRTALPFVVKKASADYGVDLEWQVANAPPVKGVSPPTKFVPGVVVGSLLAGAGWAMWRLGRRLFA